MLFRRVSCSLKPLISRNACFAGYRVLSPVGYIYGYIFGPFHPFSHKRFRDVQVLGIDDVVTALHAVGLVARNSGAELVTYVSHDIEDGAWQFLGDSMSGGQPPVISCFHHPIDKDRSLEELVDLPLGWWAERPAPSQPWTRHKDESGLDEGEDSIVREQFPQNGVVITNSHGRIVAMSLIGASEPTDPLGSRATRRKRLLSGQNGIRNEKR